MILFNFLILIFAVTIRGSHFNGGSISWIPLNPNTTGPTVTITIIQSYSWVLSQVDCQNNVPITTSGRSNENENLTCVAGCGNDGGYSTKMIDILTDCVSSSTSLNMMKSRRAKNITLNIGAYFTIAFQDGNWRTLENANGGNDWSIASLIDLRLRPDGIINTPPVSDVASPQYVIVNQSTTIRIPVYDYNIGDDIRCRWSANPGPTSVDECGDVCPSSLLPSGTTLSNCTLSFRGTLPNKWYAITLQIEDFININSTTAMSSVPIQFLIQVLPIPQCSQIPTILPLTDCLKVEVGKSINYTLFAMNTCDRTRTIISDISISIVINGMTTSQLFNSTTNPSLSYITLNWTPQSNQLGPQQLCAIAYTNEKVQSQEYCATFIVETVSNFCPTSTTMITLVTTTTTGTNTTNIPLIVGLCLLGLLLTLCCCGAWLWYFYFSRLKTRHRRKYNNKENLQLEKCTSKDGNNRSTSKEQIFEYNRFQASFGSIPNNSIVTGSLITFDSSTTKNPTTSDVIRTKKGTKSAKSSFPQSNVAQDTRRHEKLPKFESLDVSVHSLNKVHSHHHSSKQMDLSRFVNNFERSNQINPASHLSQSTKECIKPLRNKSNTESSGEKSKTVDVATVKKIKRPLRNKIDLLINI